MKNYVRTMRKLDDYPFKCDEKDDDVPPPDPIDDPPEK